MIVVIDCGLGNVGSITNMLKHIGLEAKASADPVDLAAADRLILPGVGAFDTGMERLAQTGILPLLERRVRVERTPLLGICLGMQLLTRSSQEGVRPGLGWVPADTVRFAPPASAARLRLPHMGWNDVRPARPTDLFMPIEDEIRFYFVHSFHAVCDREADVLATAHYGYDFTAAFQHGNIVGVQFHPEKSHRHGQHLLKAFGGLCTC